MSVKKKPLVSILIISYNQEDFIGEAIMSAVEQDYDNLEVIVADDCSTDKTAEIIHQYAKCFPGRVVPLTDGRNLGITGNSNRGLEACKGKYVAFQGGDDVLLPGKISRQVEWLEADSNRVICYHDMEVFLSETNETLYYQSDICRYHDGEPSLLIEYGTYFGATTAMVRVPQDQKVLFDSRIKIASDWLYWFEISHTQSGLIGRIDGVYARYRRHKNNITNSTSHLLAEAIQTLDKMQLLCPKYKNKVSNKKSEIYVIDAYHQLKKGNFGLMINSIWLSILMSKGLWVSPFKLIFNKIRSTKIGHK